MYLMSERGDEMGQRMPVSLGEPGIPRAQVSTMALVATSIICGNGWLQRGLKHGCRSWPVHTIILDISRILLEYVWL